MRRFFVILFVLLLAGTSIVPAGAESIVKPGSVYPTIYIPGRNEDVLVDDVDSENPRNVRANIDLDVGSIAKTLAPKIIKALSDDNWSEYCEALRGIVAPMFADVALDKNGEVRDNSGVIFDYSSLKNLRQIDYTYKIDTYRFTYDYRLDMYTNAAILNDYIEAVRSVTGAEKINILGRCEGANIAMAYLEGYGTPEKVNSCLFVWPSVYGLCGTTAFFTGRVSLDMDALERSLNADNTADALAASIVQVLNAVNALDSAENLFNRVYSKIRKQLMPDLILDTFGNMPSFWAMIDPEKYEQAKAFVFEGREDEYSGLIEKIDYYYTHVGARIPEIIRQYVNGGMKFSCIAKYGYPGSSLCADYKNCQTDGMATVEAASLGCTAAEYGSILSGEYISVHDSKFISPDKIIDASTCLYPESTWFVKNVNHAIMPVSLDSFCAALIAKETQPTVSDSARYPQFMIYDRRDGTLAPLSASNNVDQGSSSSSKTGIGGFFAKLIGFFSNLLNKIKALFSF